MEDSINGLLGRLRQLQQEEAAAVEMHRNMVTTFTMALVPGHIRDHNRDGYTPGLVAIGPHHAAYAERHLRAGNSLKVAYLHNLISRGHGDLDRLDAERLCAVIRHYVEPVAARKKEVLAMYPDAATPDDDFSTRRRSIRYGIVEMMVLDGCFIIEHLVNVFTGHDEPALHATPFGPAQLSVDLVLAENQIPFFVLVDLIKRTRLPELDAWGRGYQPTDLLMQLVQYYLAGDKGRDMGLLPPANEVCHILHLLHAMVTAARIRWEPPPPPRLQDGAAWLLLLRRLPLLLLVPLLHPILPEESRWRANYGREDLPSASDLKLLSVRFKKAAGGGGTPSGIASVLGLVPLAVELSPQVGNDDVARFFQQVGAASQAAGELEKTYLAHTLQKLRERASSCLFTKQADVQRYYVNVPWRLVAAFVTVVTTVASVLQTFASFKQKP